jgi:hypothetical protein
MAMKTLDDDIRHAFTALEQAVPEGYFDALPARIMERLPHARLEVDPMGPVMSTESNEPGTSPPPQGATEDHREDGEEREEHSGLHDIKAMAKTTKQRISRRVSTQSDVEESLLASASSQSLSAIVLPEPGQDEPSYESFDEADEAPAHAAATAAAATTESRGGLPIWVYGAVGAVAVAAVVFFVMRGGTKQTEVAQNDLPVAAGAADQAAPPASAPSADPAPAITPPVADPEDSDSDPTTTATGATGADGDGSEGEASPRTGAEDRDDDADKPARTRASSDAKRTSSRPAASAPSTASSSSSSSTARAEAPKPTPKAPAKPKKPDDGARSLDDLLDEASGGAVSNRDLDGAGGPAPAEPKAPVKTDLSRSEIQSGMKKVLGRVSACYDQYKEPGTVMVAVVIETSGEVSGADATGKFKNTETGLCVSEAVRRASFASWEGKPKRFNYPFLLSD